MRDRLARRADNADANDALAIDVAITTTQLAAARSVINAFDLRQLAPTMPPAAFGLWA
jgi:hypothetical protein